MFKIISKGRFLSRSKPYWSGLSPTNLQDTSFGDFFVLLKIYPAMAWLAALHSLNYLKTFVEGDEVRWTYFQLRSSFLCMFWFRDTMDLLKESRRFKTRATMTSACKMLNNFRPRFLLCLLWICALTSVRDQFDIRLILEKILHI